MYELYFECIYFVMMSLRWFGVESPLRLWRRASKYNVMILLHIRNGRSRYYTYFLDIYTSPASNNTLVPASCSYASHYHYGPFKGVLVVQLKPLKRLVHNLKDNWIATSNYLPQLMLQNFMCTRKTVMPCLERTGNHGSLMDKKCR